MRQEHTPQRRREGEGEGMIFLIRTSIISGPMTEIYGTLRDEGGEEILWGA